MTRQRRSAPSANSIAAAPTWNRSAATCSRRCAIWRSPSCPAGDDLNPLADLPDHEAAELRTYRRAPQRARPDAPVHVDGRQTQEEMLRSPYPDLLLEMIVVRMATLAPVMDADELMRALGGTGGTPPVPPSASSGGSGSGTRAAARVPDPEPAPAAGTRRLRVEGEVKADAPLRGASALTSPASAPAATASPPAQSPRAPSRLAPLGAGGAASASATPAHRICTTCPNCASISGHAAPRSPVSWNRARHSRSTAICCGSSRATTSTSAI